MVAFTTQYLSVNFPYHWFCNLGAPQKHIGSNHYRNRIINTWFSNVSFLVKFSGLTTKHYIHLKYLFINYWTHLQIILYLGMAIMSHTTNTGFFGIGSTYVLFLGLLRVHKNCRQTVKCYRTRFYFILVGTECTGAIEWVIQNKLPQLVPKWSREFVTETR